MSDLLQNAMIGFVIGTSMLIPGMSGGSVAVLLGVYDKLLCAFSDFFKNVKNNFFYLFSILIGGIIGFLLMAKLFVWVLGVAYYKTLFFFTGIIVGTVISQLRKTSLLYKKISWLFVLAGIGIVALMQMIPKNWFLISEATLLYKFAIFVFSGLLLGSALILPGVSFTLMLAILGQYDRFLTALNNLEISYLFPLGLCTIFGSIVLSKLLCTFLKRFPINCQSMIIGFVVASIFEIFPGIPKNENFLICILFLILGTALIIFVDRREKI